MNVTVEDARDAFEPNKIISGIQCNLNLVLYLYSVLFYALQPLREWAREFCHFYRKFQYIFRIGNVACDVGITTTTVAAAALLQEIDVSDDKRLLQKNTMYQRARQVNSSNGNGSRRTKENYTTNLLNIEIQKPKSTNRNNTERIKKQIKKI